jgi:hypothetical protein
MSTQILNFVKQEVVAANKEEAKELIEENLFHVNGDATQSFKNWKEKQTGMITERDIKEFMLEYLSKKSKNCPGAGYMITMESAILDTRERPYKITNVKNEEGKRKTKKQYKWIDNETNLVIGQVDTNKADAANLFKELCKEGYKGKARCEIQYDVVEGNSIVMQGEYAPSKNTKNGTWIAFGIKA